MFGNGLAWIRSTLGRLTEFPDYGESAGRYQRLRRNVIVLMVVVTLVPLFLMALVNRYQYQKTLNLETVEPLRIRMNDSKRSFEMFVSQRKSVLSLISSTRDLDELLDERTLARTLAGLKHDIGGFVDFGVVDSQGLQLGYVGPYEFKGKSYADQRWFQEVAIRGTHVSDVFLGYRQFPHFVIAVQHLSPTDDWWVLRATIDTEKVKEVISGPEFDVHSDTFIVNRAGVLQTPSEFSSGILADLNARKAEVGGVEVQGGLRLVSGTVPLSQMFGYSTAVRSLSQGRASFSMHPAGYRVVPPEELEARGLTWS